MRLKGAFGIVTGSGRGIGRAIAQALAKEGMGVVLAARTAGQVEETRVSIEAAGGRAIAVPTDVTDAGAVGRMAKAALDEFGRIDLLVNNAGSFGAIGPVWEVDPAEWWRDVTTNLQGTFNCSRAVLPHMIERGNGKIINMSGGGSAGPLPYGSAYGISKAGILRFTDTLAAECAGRGVEVYAMSPGLVRTAMTEFQIHSPEGRRWKPEIGRRFEEGADVPPTEAARVAVFLATLPHGRLVGRAFGVADDLDWIAGHVDEILEHDLHVLRLRRAQA